jgi:hypothetical protein
VPAAPALSYIVFKKVDPAFVLMSLILGFGWSLNLHAVPMYLAAQGRGILRYNILSHVLLGLCVLTGAFFPRNFLNVPSAVWGVTIGLALSAGVIIVGNALVLGLGSTVKRAFPGMLGSIIVAALLTGFAYSWFMSGGL